MDYGGLRELKTTDWRIDNQLGSMSFTTRLQLCRLSSGCWRKRGLAALTKTKDVQADRAIRLGAQNLSEITAASPGNGDR
jgi:hypothetical protein